MRQIPAYGNGKGACVGGYTWDVEELAGVVLNSGEEDQSRGISVLGDNREDLEGCEGNAGGGRLNEDECIGGYEAVV